MRCTRSGCHNVQCYVCHKSCDYAHFNDLARGGKDGNCPLFDSVEDRHADEVRSAEARARKAVVEQNPEVDAELLEIKTSDRVKRDEEKRQKASAAQAAPPFRQRPGESSLLSRPVRQSSHDQRESSSRSRPSRIIMLTERGHVQSTCPQKAGFHRSIICTCCIRQSPP